MKNKYLNRIVILGLGLLIWSCNPSIFGPNSGEILGKITDNNNKPLQGVTVSASYQDPNDNSNTNTISVQSDDKGFYIINDILFTENQINIEKVGFAKQTVTVIPSQSNRNLSANFKLNGSPEINQFNFSKTSISISNNEATTLTLNVKDVFNENAVQDMNANCQFYKNKLLFKIVNLNLDSNSNSLYLFKTDINATDFEAGTYNIIFEAVDPDNNSFSKGVTQTLTITN